MWKHLGPFDKISVVALVVDAIFRAIQEALEKAPKLTATVPALDLTGYWNFVPLILITIAGLGQLASWVFGRSAHVSPSYPVPTVAVPPTAMPDVSIASALEAPVPLAISPDDAKEAIVPRLLQDDNLIDRCMALFRERTNAQAAKLADAYIGREVEVSGIVWNVYEGEAYYRVTLAESDRSGDLRHSDRINLQFGATRMADPPIDKDLARRLDTFHRLDKITARGIIEEVNPYGISVRHCTLI